LAATREAVVVETKVTKRVNRGEGGGILERGRGRRWLGMEGVPSRSSEKKGKALPYATKDVAPGEPVSPYKNRNSVNWKRRKGATRRRGGFRLPIKPRRKKGRPAKNNYTQKEGGSCGKRSSFLSGTS